MKYKNDFRKTWKLLEFFFVRETLFLGFLVDKNIDSTLQTLTRKVSLKNWKSPRCEGFVQARFPVNNCIMGIVKSKKIKKLPNFNEMTSKNGDTQTDTESEHEENNCSETQCKDDDDSMRIKCTGCKRSLHYVCTGLPAYQLQFFIKKKGNRKYTCINCSPVYLRYPFFLMKNCSW